MIEFVSRYNWKINTDSGDMYWIVALIPSYQ